MAKTAILMPYPALQEMAAAGEVGILPDVDFDMFSGMFYPEEDFISIFGKNYL